MAPFNQRTNLLYFARGDIHHHQDFPFLDVLGEDQQLGIRHRAGNRAGHPGAQQRADQCSDQHRYQLQADAFGRREYRDDAERRATYPTNDQSQLGAVHDVGLLQDVGFVDTIQRGAARARQ